MFIYLCSKLCLAGLNSQYLLVPPRICTLSLPSFDIVLNFVFVVPELVLIRNAQYRCWTKYGGKVVQATSGVGSLISKWFTWP